MKAVRFTLLLLTAMPAVASAQPAPIARIIDEGTNRSQIMLTASELMDGIGGRLTNSPSMRKAEQWAVGKFKSYGLANAHLESFPFGRGWDFSTASARMIEPRSRWMATIPVSWTPGTNGAPLRAPIIVAPISKPAHFAAWRGKLSGKIVLISLPGLSDEPDKPAFHRLTADEIAKDDAFLMPSYDPEDLARTVEQRAFAKKLDDFLRSEGAVAIIRENYRTGGLLSGEGYNYGAADALSLPTFELTQEEYRRLARLAKTGPAPIVELASDAHYDDSVTTANNVIADIPGSDPNAGYIMAGAHFDSWIAADGASDNGAGSVIVMEAARILRAIGARPKRTIRFALWEGEEQALLGSRAYIERHLATRPMPANLPADAAYYAWPNAYPITPLPGYSALKAYFNIDNGSGKIRGIYGEGNVGTDSLLEQWLDPFAAFDAARVVAGKTGGTDHEYFQYVGLPGYQFIQDPLDYGSRVHHSNLDTLDHMRADDLRQAAVVVAGLLLQAANSDKELPRQPLPTKPVATDPFAYPNPDK